MLNFEFLKTVGILRNKKKRKLKKLSKDNFIVFVACLQKEKSYQKDTKTSNQTDTKIGNRTDIKTGNKTDTKTGNP